MQPQQLDVMQPSKGLNGAAAAHGSEGTSIRDIGDFTTSPRVLFISAIAIVVGLPGAIAGVVLLDLIRLVTNFSYSATSAPLSAILAPRPRGSRQCSCR